MPNVRDIWRIDRAGRIDRLGRQTDTLPDPAPTEARVAVKAIGVNFADVFACLGLYSATPAGPFIPGLEFSGVVEAIGSSDSPASRASASSVQPGDRVIGLIRFGAYATAVNVDTRLLRPVPAAWSFAEAAALPVQALTAWYGLVTLGGVARDDVVLVHSAAGGVGLNALSILRARGARVVGTVGHAEKKDFLVTNAALRPAQVIVRDRRTFASQLDAALASLGADGFDIVFDAVGGPFFRPAYERLRPEGRHVVFGAADFMPRGSRPNYLRLAAKYLRRPRLDPLRMIAENRALMAFNLIWLWDQAERLPAAYHALDALIHDPPFVGHRFRFAEAREALRCLQRGETIGKVVIEVRDL